jgi:hypothetical protein
MAFGWEPGERRERQRGRKLIRMKKRHGPLAPDTNDTGAIRGTVLAVTYGGRAHQLKRRS